MNAKTIVAVSGVLVLNAPSPPPAARTGGGNLGKFIEADKKIAELTNQLFPGGAGQ